MPVWQHRVIKAGMFPTDLLFSSKIQFSKKNQTALSTADVQWPKCMVLAQ